MDSRAARNSSPPPLKVSFRTALAEQRSFCFSKPFRIGRVEECDICINNDYVSRVHAEVVFENGAWWVRDLNSSNGIFVDGQRVERAPVGEATVIRLGIYGTEVSARGRSPAGGDQTSDRQRNHGGSLR